MKSFFGFVLAAVAFLSIASESQAARRVRVVVRQPVAKVRVQAVKVQAVKVQAVKVQAVKVRAPAVRVRVRVR